MKKKNISRGQVIMMLATGLVIGLVLGMLFTYKECPEPEPCPECEKCKDIYNHLAVYNWTTVDTEKLIYEIEWKRDHSTTPYYMYATRIGDDVFIHVPFGREGNNFIDKITE